MILINWAQLKTFLNSNPKTAKIYFTEDYDRFNVWTQIGGVTLFAKDILKESTDGIEFDSAYKKNGNVNEADRVRITTNKIGRRLHDRYVYFLTASNQESVKNFNQNGIDFGDLTYKTLDQNNTICPPNLATKTALDWMPACDFEISGGSILVPERALIESETWGIFVIGAPDIPEAMGGNVLFVCNPVVFGDTRKITIDASANPAELQYSQYGTNKIRFLINHPAGVVEKFQLNFKVFK